MRHRGYTLLELMIAVCVLTIILGLAVSLSRYVRAQSARVLTEDLLARLERMVSDYAAKNAGATPGVEGILREGSERATESELLRRAIFNNRDFLLAVRRGGAAEGRDGGLRELDDVPLTAYDRSSPSLRDAWGTPIVFQPGPDATLGMAPRGAGFFVSAGPDRSFMTREDNLYSYEAFPRR